MALAILLIIIAIWLLVNTFNGNFAMLTGGKAHLTWG